MSQCVCVCVHARGQVCMHANVCVLATVCMQLFNTLITNKQRTAISGVKSCFIVQNVYDNYGEKEMVQVLIYKIYLL